MAADMDKNKIKKTSNIDKIIGGIKDETISVVLSTVFNFARSKLVFPRSVIDSINVPKVFSFSFMVHGI